MEAVIAVFLLSACVKTMLFPAYRSTDFEVHRNWLAITHSLPVSKWYVEDTSQWTLDYPPFFAWFEWLLSQAAALVDPAIVQVHNLDYDAPSCVAFQRTSVLVSELLLLYAVIEFCRYREGLQPSQGMHDQLRRFVLAYHLLANFGLIVVDNIHFQYNSFLFGILILSITRVMQGRYLRGAFLFAILLNFKHIFLYIAPAYFFYLLKHHCFPSSKECNQMAKAPTSVSQFSMKNFLSLGGVVITVFSLSFGPFIAMGQFGQVLSRLFPFKRGLCHAYWAPNFWAVYNVVDIAMATVASRVGIAVHVNGSMTSGMVGEMQHQVLPAVSPLAAMVLTLVAMTPAIVRLWVKPSAPFDFLRTVILCAFSSFLFGWHVHEKAVLMITIPMSLLALEDMAALRVFVLLSTAGHLSLFPLLFASAETLIKITLFIVFTIGSISMLHMARDRLLLHHQSMPYITDTPSSPLRHFKPVWTLPYWTIWDTLLLVLLVAVQVYCCGLHGLVGVLEHLPFLPLLLTSVSCAAVILWAWLFFYYQFCFDNDSVPREDSKLRED